jgi:hypothetical protein
MKLRLAFCSAAALLAMGGTAPVFAQDTVVAVEPAPYPGERIYVAPAVRPGGLIHGGAVTAADEQLLSDTVGALSADRTLGQSMVTIVAKNGELIMNGTAKDPQSAARIEQDNPPDDAIFGRLAVRYERGERASLGAARFRHPAYE